MSRPKRRRSRLAPVLITLLVVALAAGAAWYFLFWSPAGLADTELTGYLPADAVVTANGTQKRTQTVEYTYGSEYAYCDVTTSARRTFRYEGGWEPDGQEEILDQTEDWSRLTGTWTDESEPGLAIVIQAFSGGGVAGAVTCPGGQSGLFDEFFAVGEQQSDGSYQFVGKDALSGTYLRIERENGLLFDNTQRPMDKDAPVKPSPTPAGTLEIDRDGVTETVETAATPEPAAPKTLTATAVLNVRPGPGTEQDPLGTVEVGTVLPYTGMKDGWYQVEYDGQTGYVSGDYIQVLGDAPAGTVKLLTADAAVNVRSGPDAGSEILTTVEAGAKMVAVGLSDGWYQIRYNAGRGYVSANYVTEQQALN